MKYFKHGSISLVFLLVQKGLVCGVGFAFSDRRERLESLSNYQNLDPEGQYYAEAELYRIYNDVPLKFATWGCGEWFGNWLYERLQNFQFQDRDVISEEQLLTLRREVVEILSNSIDNYLDNYSYDRLKGFSEFINRNDAIYSSSKNLGLTLEQPEIDYKQVVQAGETERANLS